MGEEGEGRGSTDAVASPCAEADTASTEVASDTLAGLEVVHGCRNKEAMGMLPEGERCEDGNGLHGDLCGSRIVGV